MSLTFCLKMKRRTIAIVVPALAIILAASWPFIRNIGRADRFLSDATEILERGADHPGIVEIVLLEGGSFRALLEHSCCSGAGFDAVALRTSDGTIYHSRNNYCGEEGFHGEMTATAHKNLTDLELYLLANGFTQAGQNKPAISSPIPSRVD